MACIDLPAFPLQLLLRSRPEWGEGPCAVVEETKPQARLLWLNERARAAGLLPGMRYAAALSLCSALRVGAVPPAAVARAVERVAERLRRFGPDVEPSGEEPGLFWMGTTGLERLHPSLGAWAAALLKELERARFSGRIVVGFRRFHVFALVRSRLVPPLFLPESPEEEEERVKAVALDRVALDAPARDLLHDLRVETVGDLLRLPLHDLEARFGEGIEPLHRGARGEAAIPVQPAEAPESAARRLFLPSPTADGARLFRLSERMLAPLLAELASRRRAAAALVLSLRLDRGGEVSERIRPAGATLDLRRLSSLLRLRLSSLRLRSPVTEIGLDAEEAPLAPEEPSLLDEPPQRDLRAAAEALARIRAEFGEGSVARARLLDAHLPEARFDWAPIEDLPPANARAVAERPLVRRILARAAPLMHPPSETVGGPYDLSGGWWRAEAGREYRYLRDRDGRWLWAFFDAGRRRWFLQGRVE